MTSREELLRSLHRVDDEASLLEFLKSLGNDWADEAAKGAVNPSSPWAPGANGWENGSIDSFLLAAVAWAAASSDGLELAGYQVPSNPWKRCAEILYAGKIYE